MAGDSLGQSLGINIPKGTSSALTGVAIQTVTSLLAKGLTKDSVQRTCNWEFLPPGIGLYAPELIGKYCQSISFGGYSIDSPVTIRYGAEQRGYAGFFSMQRMRIKFMKPSPDVVFTYFDLWKSLIKDANGFYGVKNDYGLSCYILIQDTTMDVTAVVKLQGVFPLQFPRHDLDYSKGDGLTYDLDFHVDKVTFL